MGIVKFEVDIPDFEKELQINITLKKDGEVIEKKTTSSLPPKPKSEKKKPSNDNILGSGNMMNLDF